MQTVPSATATLRIAAALLVLVAALSGCATGPSREQASARRAVVESAVPRTIADRPGWVDDLDAVFATLPVEATSENVCAVLAVAEQESGYRTDPVVTNLPAITLAEMERRAERVHVPKALVHGVLRLPSSTGESYRDRLDRARTERDLSALYDDFIGRVPLGTRLFAGLNPVHTRGPMQVHVAFATRYAKEHPYPFPADDGLPNALFSRRGSLWAGTAHLLDYDAPYDRPLYRFADYNAGQYSSRNAAFQQALGAAAGVTLTPDGALLPGDDDSPRAGDTERAARSIGAKLRLDDDAIHRALERQRDASFEETALYRRVFELADAKRGTRLPRAALPRIRLKGPKISRPLTTEWFARRVDERYARCLNGARR
jgi:hypothetical protein